MTFFVSRCQEIGSGFCVGHIWNRPDGILLGTYSAFYLSTVKIGIKDGCLLIPFDRHMRDVVYPYLREKYVAVLKTQPFAISMI